MKYTRKKKKEQKEKRKEKNKKKKKIQGLSWLLSAEI